MKNYKEYWVEYDWIDTPYGKRAMWIRSFKNRTDANEFAKSKSDAVVSEWTMHVC